MILSKSEYKHLINASHHHPHQVLGMHPHDKGLVVRALLQDAKSCEVVDLSSDERFPLKSWRMKAFSKESLTTGNQFFPIESGSSGTTGRFISSSIPTLFCLP